jgi:2-oxoglutarate/2-oxoacid ferredoxin oxidoreductase subunit alpha
LPGTHPSKGAFFTRGTTRDPYARYSERGPDYIYNMERLLRKFATAATWCRSRCSGARASRRAGRDPLRLHQPGDARGAGRARGRGLHLDALRLRAFPFPSTVAEFIAAHERVFVVEQNRDAQMRAAGQRARRRSGAPGAVLHYDGTPITARFIASAIRRDLLSERLAA